jgi:hypothetical protein
VPGVSPVTTWVVAVELNVVDGPVASPTYGVTTYPEIGEPPSDTGAVHVTVADAAPAVAGPMVGAPATVAGVTAFDAEDELPVPAELVAATVNVYVVPLTSPVTVSVVAGELNGTGVCGFAPM